MTPWKSHSFPLSSDAIWHPAGGRLSVRFPWLGPLWCLVDEQALSYPFWLNQERMEHLNSPSWWLWLFTFLLLIRDIFARSNLGQLMFLPLVFLEHLSHLGKCEYFDLGSVGSHRWTFTKMPLTSPSVGRPQMQRWRPQLCCLSSTFNRAGLLPMTTDGLLPGHVRPSDGSRIPCCLWSWP